MKLKDSLCLLLIVVVATIFLTIGFARPSIGHHDANNRMYALAAQNYIEKGVFTLQLGQLMQPLGNEINRENFYTHHPPLLSLFLAVSIFIFGPTPWAIRLVPVLFSIGSVVVFFLLLRKFFPLPLAIIGCFFFIGTPMFLMFGKMADHEALTLFFILLAVLAFVNKNNRLLLGSLFMGQWTGWPAYYLAGILFLFRRQWSLLILSLTNFILFVVHLMVLTGSPIGGGLWDILLFRMGIKNQIGQVVEQYTWLSLLKQEVSWSYRFFNPAQVWLAVLGSLWALAHRLCGQKEKIAVIFLSVATLHVLLFRTGANRHDYWLYYYLPFYAWTATLALSYLMTKVPKKYHRLVYLLGFILVLVAIWQGEPFFWALQNRVEATLDGRPI